MVSSSPREIAASVKISEMCVAMSGSIIPTPLATPTTRADEPRTVASASFGRVSVVMMARATSDASVPLGCAGSAAMPVRTRSIGYWRPMTPVEATTSSLLSQPSRAATAAMSSRAFCMPCSPVATFEFFETTTTPRVCPLAPNSRLSTTLAPAKRLLVNIDAPVVPAAPSTTTKSSESSLMPILAVCATNPAGREVMRGR